MEITSTALLALTAVVTPTVYDLYRPELRGNFLIQDERAHRYKAGMLIQVPKLPALDLGLPIYVLQGSSTEELQYTSNLNVDHVFKIKHEHDIRKAMVELRSMTKGIVVIALFELQGNMRKLTYSRDLEYANTSHHYTMGICYSGFSTDYAYRNFGGHEAYCANITRVRQKGIEHYLKYSEVFNVSVQPNE